MNHIKDCEPHPCDDDEMDFLGAIFGETTAEFYEAKGQIHAYDEDSLDRQNQNEAELQAALKHERGDQARTDLVRGETIEE